MKCHYLDCPPVLRNVLAMYSGKHGRVMVFCQTKKKVDKLMVYEELRVEDHALHEDITQKKRETVIKVCLLIP